MQLPSPPNSAAGGSNARATWETALLARVAAAKRYPAAAKAARLEGVVLLRFAMDRDGNLQNPRIEKSSGHAALDGEALAALRRAAPLPRPPLEVAGEWLDLIVPVDFYG
jgi:protein TonB